MNWWPNPEQGILGYLSPIPAFACMALPIMFATDWYVTITLRNVYCVADLCL